MGGGAVISRAAYNCRNSPSYAVQGVMHTVPFFCGSRVLDDSLTTALSATLLGAMSTKAQSLGKRQSVILEYPLGMGLYREFMQASATECSRHDVVPALQLAMRTVRN